LGYEDQVNCFTRSAKQETAEINREARIGARDRKIHQREFLKQSAFLGLSARLGGSLVKTSYALSRERLMILSSISLDTLHPYAYSSSPQYDEKIIAAEMKIR
jgi:hypothetical protein